MENLSAYADRPIAFFARYVRLPPLGSRRHPGVAWRSAVLCSVMTQYGVKLLVDTLSQAGARRNRRVARLRHARGPHRRGQSAVAPGSLGRQLDLRRRDRRRAPRPVPPSHRACAELLRQPLPRHAHQPHHGHVQRALHGREHAGVERAAALPGNGLRHRASSPPSAGAMAASLVVVGGLVVVVMFRCAAAGKPLHHEFANRAAAVDGEMTDVVGNMTIVKAFGGLRPRAPALRRHGRAGDGRAPAKPLLPRAASHHARPRDRGADDSPAGVGHRAVAAQGRDHRRRDPRVHAGPVGAARDARPGRRPGRRDAAHGAVLRGALDAARAAPDVRPSRRRPRWCAAAPASPSRR